MKLEIAFQNPKKEKINTQSLEELLNKADKLLDIPEGIISLVFTNNQDIQKLNKQWRNKDIPTDVLSFCALEGEQFPQIDEGQILGEIFISIEKAKEQAKEKNHSLQKEVEILFVHGILHIIGFTHNTDSNYKKMNKWEKKILEN